MHKYIFCLLILVGSINIAFAQKIKLKKPLTDQDFKDINKALLECFGFGTEIRVSYSTTDFYSNKYDEGEKPASLEHISMLKNKLKGNASDAGINIEISGNYARLGMRDSEEVYRKRTIDTLKKVVEERPDSVNALISLASVYMGALRFDEGIAAYRIAEVKKHEDVSITMVIANMFFMRNMLDSSYAVIERRIGQYPDEAISYSLLPMYYFYKMWGQMQGVKSEEEIQTLSTDSMINMPLLKNYCDNHKNNFDLEYRYHVGYQVLLSTITIVKCAGDTAFDYDKIKFKVKDDDKRKFLKMEKYFQSCLKRKEVENKYYPNKLLGSIYTLLDEPKKAIPYLKRAIELKPLNKSTTAHNANEDYNNLLAVYAIMKDTISFEKLVAEKLRVNPCIDPNPADYILMANVYVSQKKFDPAKEMCDKAIELENRSLVTGSQLCEGNLGLALVSYFQGNNKEALDYIERSYKANSKKWELFILYGIVLLKENDISNAYESFKEAKKLHDRKWISEDLLDKYFEKN